MNILKTFLEIISYRENPDRESFILQENIDDKIAGQDSGGESADQETAEKPRARKRKFIKPRRPSEINYGEPAAKTESPSSSLELNREVINRLYGLPENKDFVTRDFFLGMAPAY